MTLGDTEQTTRQRRQLAEAAIEHATDGNWEAAVEANRGLLELGADVDAYNRLGKALAELGDNAAALEAYQHALERDATNRIAMRNTERLRLLGASSTGNGGLDGRVVRAPATLFIEEMGKTGHARLINIAPPRQLASLSAGDAVGLRVDGEQLIVNVGTAEIGQVEPRIATRLLKLIAGGNRYEAAVTQVHDDDVRVIIREVFAHPSNFGKVSFPGSSGARAADVRPYMKGTPLRYDDDEESEEVDEDSEEVEELDTSLPEYSAEPELEEELIEET
jgi:hypothetical protein